SSASSFPKRRSVRQSLASSTAARVSWPCFSSLDSNSSNRVNASAAAPAKPARIWPSRPRRRTLRALAFITVLPSVTWPSPAMATRPSRRTDTMVVAWNTWGFWLGSMRPPGVKPRRGDRPRGLQASLPRVRLQFQEARGVVVEDRTLLRRRQERRAVHAFHREGDRFGPHHLVGAEHQPVAQARGDQRLQVVMEFLARNDPVDHRDVRVQLRVDVHQRLGFLQVGPAGVHEPDAQLWMALEHRFEQLRVA